MKKQPNLKLIGIFTVMGIALFVGFVLLFVGDKLFVDDDDLAVMYFDETLKGLKVGSPVVFRGVEVGKVAKIDIITDLDEMVFKLPVFINIDERVFRKVGDDDIKTKKAFIEKMVEKGLKGRLINQNLLTGQLMIELEIMPEVEAVYKSRAKKFVEIPTTLSPLGALSKGLQDLPVKPLLENLNELLTTANEKLPAILDEAKSITGSLNKGLKGSTRGRSNAIDNFNKALRDISEAAQTFKNLTDYLERHPESLLRGKGY